MYFVTSGWSLTGFVFAMQAMEEKPPAAAARVPVRMSSFHSYPGSLRWTCMSPSPGTTHFPPASITRPSYPLGTCSPATKSFTFPFSIHTDPVSSRFPAGSMTRPPLMRSIIPSRKKVKERHPDGDTRLHLVQDPGRCAVGQFVGKLDPPVHRARMEDHRVLLRQGKHAPVEAEHARILPQGREIGRFLALELDSQHHHDVRILHRLPDVVGDPRPGPLHFPGDQRGRAAEPELPSHPAERVQVGSYDTAVQYIPHNRYLKPFNLTFCLKDR